MQSKNILIMAGGTGGHIFPALSVARQFISDGHNVIWLGSRGGMEERIVGNTDIKIITIKSRPMRGNFKNLITAPFFALASIFSALNIIRKQKIHAVVGFGGFTAFSGGIAAWLSRKPLFIHEQNSIMGLTNKVLSKFAKQVFTSYPMDNKNKKFVASANPVRTDIANLAATPKTIKDKKIVNILVFGGSLGALAINRVMPDAVALLKNKLADADMQINIVHQAGKGKVQECKQDYEKLNLSVEVLEFIEDMPKKLAWADIGVCRAGAITLAEASCAQLVGIFVPYPYAVDNHQFFNAKYFADNEAGILLSQENLTAKNLANQLFELVQNTQKRQQIMKNILKLAKPKISLEIAKHIENKI